MTYKVRRTLRYSAVNDKPRRNTEYSTEEHREKKLSGTLRKTLRNSVVKKIKHSVTQPVPTTRESTAQLVPTIRERKKNHKAMTENHITDSILSCAFKIHTALGPGLLESAYEACLYYELQQHGLKVEKQKVLPLIYEAVKLDAGYRIDLLVEDSVVIEIKAVEALTDVHMAQILTYLKLSGCKIGLLLNFNVKSLKSGIRRVINT